MGFGINLVAKVKDMVSTVKENYDVANKSLLECDKYSGDGDGKCSVFEFQESFKSKTEDPLYKSDFRNEELSNILTKYQSMFEKHAGKDKILNPSEYISLLQDQDYKGFIDSVNSVNEYYDGASSYLSSIDSFGDKDGKATIDEYYNYQKFLYENIFEGDSVKLKKAMDLLDKEYKLMQKDAGPDNIISVDDYVTNLNSDTQRGYIEEYWQLRDE